MSGTDAQASGILLPPRDSLAKQALARKDAVNALIARLEGDPDSLQEELGKTEGLQRFVKRWHASAEEKRIAANALTIARLKLIAALARALPRGKPGRGKKNPKVHLGISDPTISKYRKVLDVVESIDDYDTALEEPGAEAEGSLGGFLRWQSNPTLVSKMTANEEAYTPEQYVEAAREVMGSIDLDPASCKAAQKVIQAGTYYTKTDDGLTKNWSGNVWLNPPYTAKVVNKFINKLCESYKDGAVEQAVLLTNNNTDTIWFHLALAVSSCACLTRGRIGFLTPEGVSCPTNGQTFFYFGDRRLDFAKSFLDFGAIIHVPDFAR